MNTDSLLSLLSLLSPLSSLSSLFSKQMNPGFAGVHLFMGLDHGIGNGNGNGPRCVPRETFQELK